MLVFSKFAQSTDVFRFMNHALVNTQCLQIASLRRDVYTPLISHCTVKPEEEEQRSKSDSDLQFEVLTEE